MQEERLAVMYPCIEEIIAREGGYWDDPLGGPTNMGITIPTLSSWRGYEVDSLAIRRLSRGEAKSILEKIYIVDPGFAGILRPFTRGHVVDAAVLHGEGDAKEWLQETADEISEVSVDVDHDIGPITLGAVNRADPREFNVKFAGRRIRYIGEITQDDPEKLQMLEGWLIRATAFLWL